MSTEKRVTSAGPDECFGTKIDPHSMAELKADLHQVSLPSAKKQCGPCKVFEARAQTAVNALLDTVEPEDGSVPPFFAHGNCGNCLMYRAKTKQALDALLV
jgi:hypothetical protein